jgi:F-type H+-transporting ATPase subunit gamma
MGVQTKAIKRRIKSVKNTRKITKAMELVAASKMRKAVNSVLGTRPYAKLAWETVLSIGKVTDTSLHPMLHSKDEVKNVLVLLITSDRGLAGGFNSNIIRMATNKITEMSKDKNIKVVTIGKRGADTIKRKDIELLATFNGITNNTKFEEVLPIGRMLVDEFKNGNFDEVLIAYTDYVSVITQTPLILKLLPLGTPEDVKEIGGVDSADNKDDVSEKNLLEYTFEPSPEEVLDKILPRLVETMVYQAVLESSASEHAARMMAMKSASDNAEDMIEDLTFTYNQARQAGITQEIAEISSGKAALEG